MQLRPLREADESLFQALYTDAQTMRFVGGPWTPAEAARRFRAILSRQGAPTPADRFLVIEEISNREPMGICGSSHYDRAGMRVEVGVMLLPQGRGLGVGRAALGALVDYMFQEPSLLEVYARVAIENSAARNLVTRVGFRQSRVAEGKKQGTLACEWSVHRSQWNTGQTTNNGIADVQCN